VRFERRFEYDDGSSDSPGALFRRIGRNEVVNREESERMTVRPRFR
jgi:hypothetical protein